MPLRSYPSNDPQVGINFFHSPAICWQGLTRPIEPCQASVSFCVKTLSPRDNSSRLPILAEIERTSMFQALGKQRIPIGSRPRGMGIVLSLVESGVLGINA